MLNVEVLALRCLRPHWVPDFLTTIQCKWFIHIVIELCEQNINIVDILRAESGIVSPLKHIICDHMLGQYVTLVLVYIALVLILSMQSCISCLIEDLDNVVINVQLVSRSLLY